MRLVSALFGSVKALIVALIFLCIGGAVTVWGFTILRDARASTNWPAIRGRITHAAITENHDDDGVTYGADITYEYVVGDQNYVGDTVNFGEYSSSNQNHAREIVDRYPEGKTVTVYYHPNDPGKSVLEPGTTVSSYMVFCIGLVFALGVPGLVVLGALRNLVR